MIRQRSLTQTMTLRDHARPHAVTVHLKSTQKFIALTDIRGRTATSRSVSPVLFMTETQACPSSSTAYLQFPNCTLFSCP